MKIITGRTGTNHVTSDDDRALHAGIFGTGSCVLSTGSRLAVTIASSNTIRISSGDIVHQGTHARIPYGDYEDVTIDNGTSGYYRNDLIVARYTKASGIESVELAVIKGTPSTTAAVTPEYNTGNILQGATVSDMPLYVVALNGVNIASVTAQFVTCAANLNDVYSKDDINTRFSGIYSKEEIDTKTNSLATSISGVNATAQNAATAAQNAATAAQNSMNVAKKGFVLNAVRTQTITLNAGSSGIAVITNFEQNVTVPNQTEYVFAILKSIPTGVEFNSVSTEINGTTCKLSGSAANEAGSSRKITFELLCFAKAENI